MTMEVKKAVTMSAFVERAARARHKNRARQGGEERGKTPAQIPIRT